MSYDLMVFDAASAPKNKTEFLNWYKEKVKWSEGHGYDDPLITTPELGNWYEEMILNYPDLNGPQIEDDEDFEEGTTEYSIGKDVIYTCFDWDDSDEAFELVVKLAEKHKVGFFDVSSEKGTTLWPHNGKLVSLEKLNSSDGGDAKKPWWKIFS